MTEKNDFKLDVVSIRLVKEAPIYSEQSFNKPEEVAAVMGECMCQFDREVVCVVNLSSDLKPINVHFASVGSLNEAMAHPRELFGSFSISLKPCCSNHFVSLIKWFFFVPTTVTNPFFCCFFASSITNWSKLYPCP